MKECRECGKSFLPRFDKQECCDSCRGDHDTMPILHPNTDRGIDKQDTVWVCKDCEKLFYGGL